MDRETIDYYQENAPELAARYDELSPTALQGLLADFLPKSGRVLEIGCGSGREALFMAERGIQVTAIDPVPKMVAITAAKLKNYPGSRVIHAGLPLADDHPLLAERFDVILISAVLMHVPESDLFGFAWQVSRLAGENGLLIISNSTGRHGLNEKSRDRHGRLFRERPAAEIALIFERLGFSMLLLDSSADSMERPDLVWDTMVFRHQRLGARPLDQIESIVNRDRKTATYKLALLRALCSIAQTAGRHVNWHLDGTVSLPLELVSEKWLYYYWPLVEVREGLFPQLRGGEERKPMAFRKELSALINHFDNQGGLSAFHAARLSGRLNDVEQKLLRTALNKIGRTIVLGPVTYTGGSLAEADPFFTFRPAGFKKFHDGEIYMPAEVWREMCLLGHWLGEAIILRWAELVHDFSGRNLAVSAILDRLLKQPESERDVSEARSLLAEWPGRICVWSGQQLTGRFDVDHLIPFSLWRNNDLWNLLPSSPQINAAKRDRLVSRDLLQASRERLLNCWRYFFKRNPRRFTVGLSRTLMAQPILKDGWEHPAFTALLEAVETLAVQRDLPRWP